MSSMQGFLKKPTNSLFSSPPATIFNLEINERTTLDEAETVPPKVKFH